MTVAGVHELFTVGLGPSSSHTVGPMVAARAFATRLAESGDLTRISRVQVDLLGSLGATGRGHGTDHAVILGLAGEDPAVLEPADGRRIIARVGATGALDLLGEHPVAFDPETDIALHPRLRPQRHPNALRLRALDSDGGAVAERTYYSVGGGFVVDEQDHPVRGRRTPTTTVPYPFTTGAELLRHTASTGLPISSVMRGNELATHTDEELTDHLQRVWQVMRECVTRGLTTRGTLPGGLGVRRRAADLHARLTDGRAAWAVAAVDRVSAWAIAVNEENAAGGRVVTAPTNGAAGVVPAVLHHFVHHVAADTAPAERAEAVERFLLTAGAIGGIIKAGASISGAEVGCQGEVGSACAMAAAGLCEVLGGTPAQVENAAEIALEHHLGLTCDPVAGLVQIPCIERNAVAAVTAIQSAQLSLNGDGTHRVCLDTAIRTMRETGADMSTKYKETAEGGLALNVVAC